MRAFIIDPYERSITEFDYDGDYKEIMRVVQCGMFTLTHMGLVDLFVNDNGMYEETAWFGLPRDVNPHLLWGRALVTATDPMTGEAAPVPDGITLAGLTRIVKWLTPDEALRKAGEADEAMAEYARKNPGIISLGGNMEGMVMDAIAKIDRETAANDNK